MKQCAGQALWLDMLCLSLMPADTVLVTLLLGFRKVCKAMKIPLQRVGHWAKVETI